MIGRAGAPATPSKDPMLVVLGAGGLSFHP